MTDTEAPVATSLYIDIIGALSEEGKAALTGDLAFALEDACGKVQAQIEQDVSQIVSLLASGAQFAEPGPEAV